MKTSRTLILLLAAVPAIPAFANKTSSPSDSFRISCEAKLINSGKPVTLNAQSKIFQARKGAVTGSSSEVQLAIGPYTLVSQIEEINERSATDVLVAPPFNPRLSMNIFEGDPVGNSIFRASLDGFDWLELKRPLTLSGSQFRNFEFQGVKYTRLDYQCALGKAKAGSI